MQHNAQLSLHICWNLDVLFLIRLHVAGSNEINVVLKGFLHDHAARTRLPRLRPSGSSAAHRRQTVARRCDRSHRDAEHIDSEGNVAAASL